MSPVTLDDPSAYFARLAAFEAGHWWSEMLWRIAGHWLDAALRGRSGLVALDVGSGAGLTLERMARRPEVGRVVGLEPEAPAIGHARGRGDHLVRGSALDLPFRSGTFDVVTCLDVLQHLPAGGASRASSELARVLAPGGVAIVRTNAGGREGFRLEGLRETLEQAGFRVQRATLVNASGSVAQEVLGRLRPARVRPHPGGGGLPSPTSGPVRGWIMRGVGRAEAFAVGRLGWDLPFGHSAMLLAFRVDGTADLAFRQPGVWGR